MKAAKALDPTRPVALAVAAAPTVGCQSEYGPLDIIGLNDYFGWYPGTNGVIADRDLLSEYLDSVRACYPSKALMISEFGAEANRDGPPEERGTFSFQQDFVNFHLGVYATKPWLSGAIYWALQEFRVRPDWDGGNPRPAAADPSEGPGDVRRRPQARVLRRPAAVPRNPADRRGHATVGGGRPRRSGCRPPQLRSRYHRLPLMADSKTTALTISTRCPGGLARHAPPAP